MELADKYVVVKMPIQEYEAMSESWTKIKILERLVRREKTAFIDGEVIRSVLGIEQVEKGDSE